MGKKKNKKYLYIGISAMVIIIISVIIIVYFIFFNINEKVENYANETAEILSSHDIIKINSLIFDYDELNIDDEICDIYYDGSNQSFDLMKNIFEHVSVQTKKVAKEVIIYKIKAPNLSELMNDFINENNANLSSDQFKEYITKYIESADTVTNTVEVNYSINSDNKIEVNLRTKEFINALTGGLLENYEKVYKNISEQLMDREE